MARAARTTAPTSASCSGSSASVLATCWFGTTRTCSGICGLRSRNAVTCAFLSQLTAPLTLVRQDDGALGRVNRLREGKGRQQRGEHAAATLLGRFAQDGAPARLPPLVGRVAHQAARGDDRGDRRRAQFGQLLQD